MEVEIEILPKQKLYKTAFSPMYNVFVGIDHAHQDVDGRWIYTCESSYNPDVILKDHLFREEELERLCL
jgi:hypothetical protein